MAFGVALTNTKGSTIDSVTIRFNAEFWRSSTAVQNTLAFAYGLSSGGASNADFLTSASMLADTRLDVVGPQPVSSNGPLDGNVAPNRQAVSVLLENLNWQAGTTLFIRWTDFNDGGNDAGLAVDDFSINEGAFVDSNDVSRGTANTLFTPTSFCGAPFVAANNAVFDGTAATVSLSGAVVANSLKFTTTGYTLNSPTGSDTLALTSGKIDVGSSLTATVPATLVGTAGLEKSGLGTLALSGANTFTGNVTIAAGRLEIPGESALGDAGNDLVFGGTLATTGNLSLGAGRTLSGTGIIETATNGSLTIAGPLANAALTVNGPDTVALNGATNVATSLTFSQPVALGIATGELTIASSLNFAQTSGSSTITGGLNFGTATRTLSVAGGTLTPSGTFTAALTAGNRIIKTGAGTLDLTSTTFSGTGAFRIGVQGGFPSEGGKVIVNDTTDLGTLQTQFNSGILEAATPLAFTTGLSIGGRKDSVVSRSTLAGANLSFAGDSSFFAAGGASGDYALSVNNVTTFNGTFAATIAPSASVPEPVENPIDIDGTGTLVFGGDASALLDRIFLFGDVTLAIEGTLGSLRITANEGTTLTGGGTYSGYHIPAGTGIPELYKESNVFIKSGATLAPTGTLALRSNLTLETGSTTIFSINGPTIDTGYDSIDVSIPAGATATIPAYTLTYGGSLTLDFGAPAANGTYSLFTTGANVTRTGSFGSVFVTGTYSDTLTQNGTVWSNVIGGKTFSFDESTGVLTVSGGVSPLEAWRATNFPGSTATTGPGADNADFDGDGQSNLLEYATGTNPTVANASVVNVARFNDVLTLTYPVIDDPSITYRVLGTGDLATAFQPATGATVINGGSATYTDNVSLSTGGVRRFLRLEVGYAAD